MEDISIQLEWKVHVNNEERKDNSFQENKWIISNSGDFSIFV